ncbi:DUF1120 domain-containing protein [Pseudomonas sp. dw_358]|uniref:DUF1120 domain-containing protein n=1 Tax=Pseudomonas sp. dw_358 TaxID=2720083 RepID=UPI001BD54A4A|nr:DUF1120 domain-containing protein [Pseudomonas sp. dw_358]
MTFKKISLGVVLGLGLAATSGVFADESVDLSVIGTITPTACDITLSKYTVDLGNINSKALSATVINELRSDTVDLNVLCDAPARFTLATVDNGAGSALRDDSASFGLGFAEGDAKIGYFSMRFNGSTLDADGTSVLGLASVDKATWAEASTAPDAGPGAVTGPALNHGANYLAFGETVAAGVKEITELNGTLQVRTFVAPTSDLNLNDDIELDGSATIEVMYL